jgi:Fe-S cluster assembly protein SufD
MSLASAIRTRDVAELPSRRDEDWRWSDLRALIRVMPAPSPAVAAAAQNPALAGIEGARILYINGRLIDGDAVRIPATGKGAFVRRFVSASEGTAHHLDAPVEVQAEGRLTLIDSFEGQGGGYLASATGAIVLGEGAALERIVFLDEPEDAVSVAKFEVTLSPGATYRQTVFAAGAKRQRIETVVRHPGAGAVARLDGAYILGGTRHSDQTTSVIHVGADGETVQLCKGVAADRARAVFQGRIVVQAGADGTDARMGHHGLILSDRAEIDAKPELLIYADDVQCAHGNTVGALDQEAIFYARSRGLPEPAAKALMTAAFIGAVVERIEHQGAQDLARTWVDTKLEALI